MCRCIFCVNFRCTPPRFPTALSCKKNLIFYVYDPKPTKCQRRQRVQTKRMHFCHFVNKPAKQKKPSPLNTVRWGTLEPRTRPKNNKQAVILKPTSCKNVEHFTNMLFYFLLCTVSQSAAGSPFVVCKVLSLRRGDRLVVLLFNALFRRVLHFALVPLQQFVVRYRLRNGNPESPISVP